MAQIAKLQEQMAAAQAEIAEAQVTETAGGGAVSITMTGDQKCVAVTVQEDVLKDADAEMLQDLVLSAVNLALDDSRKLASEKLGPLAGGMPGLF